MIVNEDDVEIIYKNHTMYIKNQYGKFEKVALNNNYIKRRNKLIKELNEAV